MATTSEDLIASDSAEAIELNVLDDLNCTLCMKVFRSPRSLPCSHSFCHNCLQSHISHSASVKDTLKEFSCPVCETGVSLREDIAVDKWVYSFPLNTLLLSVLIKLKVKVNIVCDICQVLDTTNPAKNICIACEQALCENCSKVHNYYRYSSTHYILKVDELPSRQDIVLKHNSMFKCVDHAHNPLDLYCKTHEVQLCSKCFTSKHTSCSEVFDVKNETPTISDILKDVNVRIKALEDQYKRFTDINVSNLKQLDSQIQNLMEEITTLKRRINTALDDMETRVRTECQKIYYDEENKLEKNNLRFKSQIMSIRNSSYVINYVSGFATESQTLLLAKRILSQLSVSLSQVDKRYNDNAILKLDLEINPLLEYIVSIPKGELVKMKMTGNSENTVLTHGLKSLKGCMVEAVDVREIEVYGDEYPCYTDVVYVFPDNILLTDHANEVCHLLDTLFDSVSIFRLPGCPGQVSVVCQNEIAVSVPENKTIKFLLVKDNTITQTREVKTRHMCSGIAIVSLDEMIISGPCGKDSLYYWSVVTLDGKEKSYHEFDGEGDAQTYVALNTLTTRIYISVYEDSSIHCFGFDGQKHFIFKHQYLNGTQKVVIDKNDYVYAVGSSSNNIFQLSPDGIIIQIITNVIPNNPVAMCFNEGGDGFLLTCYDSKDIHEFKFDFTKGTTQQMGQMFQAGGGGYFVPVMPQAAQQGFYTPQTIPQMRAGPRWPTVRPSQPTAQSGFQSLPSGPQVRPARPSGAAQYNMRPNVNVRAIAGPNTTTQPRATMPVTHSNVRVRPAPANMYPQQRQRPFKLPEQPMRNGPQHQQNPPLAVVVQGQEPLTYQMLDSAPPQEQKQMLGEHLFPLIQRMYPDLAGKITGMLLEIENYELMHMLESSESLKAK
ncbi:hypothetical protein ACJMK2_000739 [Sinanodonta woodiana]|uniref:Uncharacterized protein n=1 Tax=Sinanodonta woodiana TaxID=1069815 RepID=A0ABD3XRX7_SINWO